MTIPKYVAKTVAVSVLSVSLLLPTTFNAEAATTQTEAVVTTAQQELMRVNAFAPNTTTDYPAIGDHVEGAAKMIEKDGKQFAEITVVQRSASLIAALKTEVNGAEVDAEKKENANGTVTFTVPVVQGQPAKSQMHVYAPAHHMDKWYPFLLQVEPFKMSVYKNDSNEESMMKQYMSSTVRVIPAGATNKVQVTIPAGKYIQSFKVEGKDAELIKDNTATSGERIYQYEQADLTRLTTADLHVIVNEGPVNYDSTHTVQLSLSAAKAEKPNPFKDIAKDSNREAILNLYQQGIVKEAANFNPTNSLKRSQFALMVGRTIGITRAGQEAGFKDIAAMDAESKLMINGLAEKNIVKKFENFNPAGTLTREQGALMLYRAVTNAKGSAPAVKDSSLSYYVDGASVKDAEVRTALAYLYEQGIMTGAPTATGGKQINAQQQLTRTQMAKILNGSLSVIKK